MKRPGSRQWLAMCILLVLLLAFAGCTRNVESTATSKPTTAATAKAITQPPPQARRWNLTRWYGIFSITGSVNPTKNSSKTPWPIT
jgi:predicted lysophospholipase L1 biosynthesis ABC-type transport system permease subunit